ncbi:CapA family protein [Paenibacillus cellulosilyticus]|nr:CapA family protein [Paenibacillus cellulosilyticus]QKS43805.1 CapA family protein [Paenibacillus cellulosilyticus]
MPQVAVTEPVEGVVQGGQQGDSAADESAEAEDSSAADTTDNAVSTDNAADTNTDTAVGNTAETDHDSSGSDSQATTGIEQSGDETSESDSTGDGTDSESVTPIEPDSVETSVTLAAIGDVLIHRPIYREAEQKDGTYDFSSVFQLVKNTMLQPDLLIANQESMIGGKEIGLSTYPSFNSPHEVGDTLKDVGVDFVTVANNHTLDRGEKAIQSALKYWDKIGMPYTGAFKSKADQAKIRTITRNDITSSVLAYTYGTNGIAVPTGKDYLVNLIDMNKIEADVKQAKQVSDVVVVAMHWGTEYEDFPNKQQQQLAQQLADLGVDIVIGNHPHVLQPPAWLEGQDGHQTFVWYSLGNYISSQEGVKKQIGGIGYLDVVKTTVDGQSTITLRSPGFMPTYVYFNNWKDYRITPLEQTKDSELPQANNQFNATMKHMRSSLPELSLIHPAAS